MHELLLTVLISFSPDGCTFFPNGTFAQPDIWAHCCFEHDLFYWAGGTEKQRLSADQNLRQCIADTDHEYIAELVYYAVRVGRNSPIKKESQAWGYAWGDHPPYRKLTPVDIESVRQELETYEIDLEVKQRLMESLIAIVIDY